MTHLVENQKLIEINGQILYLLGERLSAFGKELALSCSASCAMPSEEGNSLSSCQSVENADILRNIWISLIHLLVSDSESIKNAAIMDVDMFAELLRMYDDVDKCPMNDIDNKEYMRFLNLASSDTKLEALTKTITSMKLKLFID